MNIVVLRPSGNYYFRPDTTLNREACDYYIPDGVEGLDLVPCIYARVTKAGKCIAKKFAPRHIDNFGFGVFLDAAGVDTQEAICMDATSYLSGDTLPLSGIGDSKFEISVNGETCFRQDNFNEDMLYDALASISVRSSVRATDLVAVCLPASIRLHKGDYFSFCGRKVNIL